MSDHDHRSNRQVLYIVACAAPPAMDVGVLIDLAQQDGWDVCLIATPRAFQWLDVPGLAGRTGHPVRHDYKLPGEPDLLPEPDAIIVAPATFNTINKWAAGIADTLALGLLCEATGKGLPVVVLPVSECRPRRASRARGEHRAAPPPGGPRPVRPRCAAAASASPGQARPVPLAPHPPRPQGGC